MITSRAKRIGIIASVYCVVTLVVLVGTIYYTEHNKKKFANVRERHAEARAAQQLATTINQTLRVSERDREALDSFFISERGTIHFITRVETLAQKFGVSVETTQLSVVPVKDDKPSQLQIGFVTKGTYSNVVQMLSALETLPYHRSIPEVSIKRLDTGGWSGSIVIYVTLQ